MKNLLKTKVVNQKGNILGYYILSGECVKIYNKQNKLIRNILDNNYKAINAHIFLTNYNFNKNIAYSAHTMCDLDIKTLTNKGV